MLIFTFLFGLLLGSVVNQSLCQAEVLVPIAPSSSVITIQPPVGLPSHAYTNPSSGVVTVQPPVGLPSHVYTNPSSGVQTIQPSVGLPSYAYPSTPSYGGYDGNK